MSRIRAVFAWLWSVWGMRFTALVLLLALIAGFNLLIYCEAARLSEIAGLKTALAAKEEMNNLLGDINSENKAKISRLELLTGPGTELGKVRKDMEDQEVHLNRLEQRVVDLINEKRALNMEITRLADEAMVSTNTIAALNRQHSDVLEEVKIFRARIATQDLDLRRVRGEIGTLTSQLAALHAAELAHQETHCQAQIAALNSRILTQEREIDRLQLQNAYLRNGQSLPSTNPTNVGIYTYGVIDNTRVGIEFWPKDMTSGSDSSGYPLPPSDNPNWPKSIEFTTANSSTGNPCFMINGVPSDKYTYVVSELVRGSWTRRFANWFVVTAGCNVSTLTRPDGTSFELSTNHGQLILHRRTWSTRDGGIAENQRTAIRQ